MIRKFVLALSFFSLISCTGMDGKVRDYLDGGIADYNSKEYNSSISKLNEVISIDKSSR
jgi:hypothetical protein